MASLRIALAQVNPTVGDLAGNAARIQEYIKRAENLGADLIAFPELVLTGYPPEDLLLKPSFVADNLEWLGRIVASTGDICAVVGFVDSAEDIYNAAAIVQDGHLAGVYHKQYLPTYGVFDEDRYFRAGTDAPVFNIKGVPVGVTVCEDIWYPDGPARLQGLAGAQLIVNINGSPYHRGKRSERERMVSTRASDQGIFVAYVNLVGGQDELVFDGDSFIVDQDGSLVVRGKQFAEDLVVADLDFSGVFRSRLHNPRLRKDRETLPRGVVREIEVSPASRYPIERPPCPVEPQEVSEPGSPQEIYEALVLGTHDYVSKNGFKSVVIGLSGGIDSSLTAVIAVDALGPDRVMGMAMPSRYSSRSSIDDARDMAGRLGIKLFELSIEPPFQAALETLREVFAGTKPGLAEENIQARLRGLLLMSISNKFGPLVLTTGNKSEMATGYCTLYGDMAGGFAVLKDVPKTTVYELSYYRNQHGPGSPIPESVLVKPPSAELRPDQKDVDSLPPYEILDPIMRAYVEDDRSFDEIVRLGFDEGTVRRVVTLVDHSEYKRRQAPPGVKITPRAFGRDRRMPITNAYQGTK